MLTEDYIMRMISQALAVLLTALGLKKAGKYDEALQSFDQAIETLLGLNAHLVSQLDDGMLLDKLTFLGRLDVERLLVLADIYREQAEVYNTLGQTENGQFASQRSLRLYLETGLASQAELDHELVQKIEGLRKNLDPLRLPVETRLATQDYLDRLLACEDDFLTTNGLSRSSLQAAQAYLANLDLQ